MDREVTTVQNDRDKKLFKASEKEGITPEELILRIVDNHLARNTSRNDYLRAYDSLTPRQQELHHLLYFLRLASRRQLGNAVSVHVNRESDAINAVRCLENMADKGLVEVHNPLGVQPRHLFALSTAGVFVGDVLRGHWNKKTRKPFPPELLQPTRIEHHLNLVDTAVSFISPGNRNGKLIEWSHDGETRYRFVHLGTKHVIVPDGVGLWMNDEGVYPLHFELHGANTTKAVIAKVRKYSAFITSGSYIRGCLTVPPVLIVTRRYQTGTMGRAVVAGTLKAHLSIQAAAKRMVFGVCHLTELVERGPFSAIWYLPLQAANETTLQDILTLAGKLPRT